MSGNNDTTTAAKQIKSLQVPLVQIVTNPGSNLDPRAIEHFDVHLTGQQIAVDGTYHDTREDVPLTDIDHWVATAKRHPQVIGTTASEFVKIFSELGRDGGDILAVMTSQKLIHSYDSALDAVDILQKSTRLSAQKVVVVDSKVTDVGAGLLVLLAAQAQRDGLDLEALTSLLAAAAKNLEMVVGLATLDNLVKGGKAGPLRAWLANLFNVRPIIGFVDGELKSLGTYPAKEDSADYLLKHFEKKFGMGRRLWVAISHGQQAEKAALFESRLRKSFDVKYCYRRPLSPSIYLHAGPGSLAAAAIPLDRLPWQPRAVPPV